MKRAKNSELPFLSLFTGIVFAIIGITGKVFLGYAGNWRISPVSSGERWIFLLAGMFLIALSIPFLRKQKFSTPRYSDEEVKQAKEKLDRMFLRENGSLPEESTPEEPKSEKIKPKTAPGRSASAPKITAPIRQGLLAMLAGVVLFLTGNMVMMIMAAALFLFGLCRLVRGLMEVV